MATADHSLDDLNNDYIDVAPHAQCWRGADLLKLVLNDLARFGYHKTAIDAWRHDGTAHNVRHSYGGGRWNLACWHDGQTTVAHVGWPDHTSLAVVAQLLHAMLPPALSTPRDTRGPSAA